MKKIILSTLLISTVMFAKTESIWPNISNKVDFNIIEEKDKAIGIKEGLLSDIPSVYTTFKDILQKYNKTNLEIDEYLTEDNLSKIGTTKTYNSLISIKYAMHELIELKQKYNSSSNEIKEFEKEYERIKNNITKTNNNWCNEEIKNKNVKKEIEQIKKENYKL